LIRVPLLVTTLRPDEAEVVLEHELSIAAARPRRRKL